MVETGKVFRSRPFWTLLESGINSGEVRTKWLWSRATWVQILAAPLSGYITPGSLLNFSEPQFAYL